MPPLKVDALFSSLCVRLRLSLLPTVRHDVGLVLMLAVHHQPTLEDLVSMLAAHRQLTLEFLLYHLLILTTRRQ